MNVMTDTWFQIIRHVRTELRIPIWIAVNLTQPILWLLLFTQIFKSVSDLDQFGESSYLEFLAPGIVVMTVMFGAAWAGMGMLYDIDMGILSKMLATPVSRISIIMSRVFGSMVMLVIQALIIFIIAIIMGVDIATGIVGILFTIILVCLLGIGFAAFSNGLALIFRRQETLIATINFITLPTMFLSSTLMAPELLPDWLDTIRWFNPVEYAVIGVRDLILEGYIWSDLWKSIVVLTAWAAAGITFGTLAFRAKAE